MLNRHFVNNMDRSTRALNNEPNPKDYCPSCSVRLKYSSRLNDFFCSDCGYVRKEGKPIAFVIDGTNYPGNKRKGPLSSDSNSAVPTDAEIEMMKLKPLPGQAGMNRSQQSLERNSRRNLQGLDSDMQRLANADYSFQMSEEHIINDNLSYDPNELKGSFSNLQSNRRVYFR